MNIVVVSGVITSDFSQVSNDGLLFDVQVVTSGGKEGAVPIKESYMAVAYGKIAERLDVDASEGKRVIFEGRISSEKVGGEEFNHVLNISRLLSVADNKASDFDYARGTIGGTTTSKPMNELASGAFVVNFNVKTVRVYEDKKTKEMKEYKTFVDAAAWNELARSYNNTYQSVADESITLSGPLKPSSYERNGENVRRIAIWATDIVTASGPIHAGKGAGGATKAASSSSRSAPRNAATTTRAAAPAPRASASRRNVFDED